MPVPNTFANATATIPLSQLDANFATTITLGNTAIQLGNTVSTLNNMTLANVTVTSGNVTITNVTVTTANVTTANIATAQIANVTVSGTGTFAAGSNTAPSITTSGDTNTGIFFPAADTIAFTEGGVEAMRIDSAGNVGIGTSSPSSKLHLSGATTADARITLTQTTAGLTSTLQQGSSGLALSASGSQSLLLETNGVTRATIDSSGNLGLGVTPSAWRSTYKALQTNGGSFYGFTSNDRVGMSQNAYVDATSFQWTYTTTAAATNYLQISGEHQWYRAASGTAGNAITFTQAMTLDASGNWVVGRTAIVGGVRSESSKNANANYSTTFTTATSSAQLALTDFSATATYATPAATLLFGAGDSGTGWATISGIRESSQNSAIAFGTASGSSNTTERMRIDSSGNLGLGVTPSAWTLFKAQEIGRVGNSFAARPDASQVNIGCNWYYASGDKYANTAAATMYEQGSGAHRWYYAASGTAGNAITFTQAMTLDASGNLGVGITSPTGLLDVYKAAQGGSSTFRAYGPAGQILWANGGASTSYLDSDTIIFRASANSSNTERARIDSSGFTQFSSNLVMPYQGAPTSKAAAATLSGAELITGILNTTGTTYTITLPTGTNIEGALTWAGNNVSLDWTVINTASGTITIGANGNTTLGSLTIATGTSAGFRIRRTAANTFTVYRMR